MKACTGLLLLCCAVLAQAAAATEQILQVVTDDNYPALGIGLLAAVFVGWLLTMRAAVKRRTAELRET